MIKKIFYLILFFSVSSFAQVKDLQIGSTNFGNYQRQGGYYDYSKSNSINMEVNIWGFVKYPGKYLIPEGSTAMDLMSYAGGPLDAANLDDIRIFRTIIDSTNGSKSTKTEFLLFNYQDLLWNDKLEYSASYVPELIAGDNLSVPGEPKIYDKDWIQIGLSIVSILISLTTLIVTLGK